MKAFFALLLVSLAIMYTSTDAAPQGFDDSVVENKVAVDEPADTNAVAADETVETDVPAVAPGQTRGMGSFIGGALLGYMGGRRRPSHGMGGMGSGMGGGMDYYG